MMTLARVDAKGRISIRGTKKGAEYLIKAEKDGWWITPVPEIKARKSNNREWKGSKLSLAEHLSRLAKNGLRIERSKIAQQKVPKCRF